MFGDDLWITVTAVVSVAMFVAGLVLVPVVVARLPVDYLVGEPVRKAHGPLLRVGRNLLGAVLVVAGVAMLVLPGQGIVTIVIGLSLLDFPGRQRLVRRILGQSTVLRGVNAIRRRARKPPLSAPTDAARSSTT